MKYVLLISAVLIIPDLFGQTLPDLRVSFDLQQQTLANVLAAFEQKAGIRFSYNPRKIQAEQKIDFRTASISVKEALAKLCEQTGLDYTLMESQVVLTPKRKTNETNPAATLSGYIKDATNGEALIGAAVYVPLAKTGTTTNSYGFFSITLPQGRYDVSFSYLGYKTVHTTLDLASSTQQNYCLNEDSPVLEEVLVTTTESLPLEEQTISQLTLRPKTVEERPALFGEMDVIKSMESLPGVKLHSDGSTFYYVRGGHRDQNLILIDDSPIYNPSHLLGLFSTVIPDATTNITLYKGNMPASYGGRLSSVLDVHTRKGNDQHVQWWGNVGLISTKLGIEGPIKKNASSFLLSGRVSRLKWLFQLVDPSITQFNFYDLTGKVNVKLNARNHTYLSFYTGSDNYFAGNNGIRWINTAGTLRWTNVYSSRFFINTTLSASSYDYSLYTNVSQNQFWNSHISNVNFKSDFSYFIKPQNELSFGIGINGYNFNPGNVTTNNVANSNVSARHSLETVLYGNHQFQRDNWSFNYGLRITSWANFGEAFEFLYNQNYQPVDTMVFQAGQSYVRFLNAEPRFAIQYQLTPTGIIKIGYARHVQNIHLISNSISPFTSLDVWLPSSFNIKPQISNQITAGYYHTFEKQGIAFSGELYYKLQKNQIDFDSHAEILLNPFFESELRFGKARAYGLELIAKKDLGRLRGSAGYTFSKVTRTFSDINNGFSYNALFDRPHQFNIALSYDLTTRWSLGTSWGFLSGSTYSAPVSFYQFNGLEVPVYSQKNNARLPSYHRLDVSANLKLNRNSESKFKHELSFSIFNFYGRKNPLYINYNKEELAFRDFKVPTDLLHSQHAISQFYLFRFSPSVTYNFRWR